MGDSLADLLAFGALSTDSKLANPGTVDWALHTRGKEHQGTAVEMKNHPQCEIDHQAADPPEALAAWECLATSMDLPTYTEEVNERGYKPKSKKGKPLNK